MTKTKRTIRAIIALVMAIVMVGSVIPTMAYAADVADSLENQLDQSATFLEKVTTAIYNFFQRIINFFRNLFGKGDEEPEPEVPDNNKVEVGDEEALKAVLKDGGKVYLAQNFDCKGGESIVIPGNVSVTIYLQGNTIKNPVSGKPAIINKGELTIYGDGAIINGANDVSGSHTILNTGTLIINGGNIGTDYTAGAAVINDGGFVTINGGTYASRQEAVEGDSRSVYAFVNEKGTMVVNNANLEGRTHGLFAAYAGDLIVNGGMYKMDGNGGLGCYVAYAEDSAEVLLIGGIVHTNTPRNNHVFYVSDNGDKFDADAVATDNITYVGTEIYLNGVKQDYSESTPWTVSGGTLYLKDVTITAKDGNALTVKDDTKIIIDGTVKLIGAKNGAGIFVESNARLEITGSGSLTVIGNEGKEYDKNKYYCEGNYTDFEGTGGSGIGVESGGMLVVDGLNELTAEGYGLHAFGIGGNGAIVKIEDSTVKYVRGGFVNVTGKYYDEKYNKSEPEGGAAIGGSDIGILKSHIIKAEGGSKAAGIGAQYHQPANITIRFSEIDKVVGGSSSAGIGGSRISKDYPGQDVNIIIEDSKISAYGGYFGAGIGSGYDTNCSATELAPMHTIYIKGNSEINATGGKYAAGIGTGYHVANLKGEIETTVKVTAQSGEKFYKAAYTRAQDIGFGVVDVEREGKNNYSTFKYMGIEIGIPEPINPVVTLKVTEKLDLMLDGIAKAIEVTIDPENATITGKSFISSDESVATVDETGLVTPIALGKATISVTVASNDGSIKTAETEVVVNPVPVDSVIVEPEKVIFVLDETVTQTQALSASVEPENATFKDVEWKSSNEAVATVDANGVVTAKGRGRATITATSTFDAAKYGEVLVEVQKIEGEKFADDPAELKEVMLACEKGGSVNIALDSDVLVTADTPLLYSNYMFIANGRNVTIDLNGNNIVIDETFVKRPIPLFSTANNGTLNIVGEGTIEVKNGCAGIFQAMNANTHINIYGGTYISNSDNGANGLAIIYTNSGNVDVYGGTFITPEGVECANAQDTQGNRLSIVFHEGAILKNNKYYAGSDASRIKIDETCRLVAVEIDGETWYKVVKYVPATEFSADKTAFELEKGTEAEFNVTLEPADVTYSNITMTSSDETVATVDASGKIKAVANGTAIITVSTDDPDLAPIEITVKVHTVTSDYDFLMENKTHSGTCILDNNMIATDLIFFGSGTDVLLDLNGKTVDAAKKTQYLFGAQSGGTLCLTGNGTVNAGLGFYSNKEDAVITIENGTYYFDTTKTLDKLAVHSLAQKNSKIIINGGKFISKVDNALLFYTIYGSVIEINGGFFENEADKTPDLLEAALNPDYNNRIYIKGGTFVNYNPMDEKGYYTGDLNNIPDGPYIVICEGYTVVAEEQANGDIWYSVVEHIPLEEITVDKTDIRLLVGETDKITAGIIPANATHNKLTYTSSDESIATVDAQGNITAISRGKVTITVAEKNDNKQTVVTVKVEEPDPAGSYPVYTVEELKAAIESGETFIALKEDFEITEPIIIPAGADVTIHGKGNTIARAEGGEAANMISVSDGATITLVDVTVDGGAEWSGEINEYLLRGTTNIGMTTTGAIIAASSKSNIILGEGAVLQNNDGANAVNLGTRIGATLTLNGGEIINNHSAAGAIWGGGAITVNSGKINGNHGGIGGAIRVVTNVGTVLTMNGGEMNHNISDGVGGAIWAGTSKSSNTYVLNGGEMAYNYSPTGGGAMFAGNYETVKISGDFKMHDNEAPLAGAIRFGDHASFVMTGGEIYDNGDNPVFLYNNSTSITGGRIEEDFSYSGGLGLTMGEADIEGVVTYNLSTNHNTAYLAVNFNSFKFKVTEGTANFAAFNFKPAADYVYTEGDEDKLVCMNEGYKTYWDAAKGVFKIKEYVDLFVDELVEGGEIVLEADVVLSETVKIENETKIDLNGKTLSVDKLLLAADTTIEGGKLIQSEPEIREEYGYVLQQNCPFTVESGTLTLINTTVEIDTPSTLSINNNSVIETVGINVKGGKVVIENSDIVVKNDRAYGNLLQYEGVFGVIIDSGELTMKDSSLTIEGIGARDGNDYIAILGGKSADVKSVNLENVQISCAQFYALGSGKNLTVNTNADASEWAGKYVNCTVNFGA